MFDLTSLIVTLGYFGVAVIIFAESGLFFGFFLPGDSLLFTAGFLASQGYINLWLLIPFVVVSAILGDSFGYWFGTYVGPKVFKKSNSFWFSGERAKDAERFFERHGAKSLILARFIPAVRTFTPIVAGVGRMDYKTFLTYNVLGGVLWGVSVPLLGYYLGSTIPGVDRYLLPIIGAILVISVLPVLFEWLKRRNTPG